MVFSSSKLSLLVVRCCPYSMSFILLRSVSIFVTVSSSVIAPGVSSYLLCFSVDRDISLSLELRETVLPYTNGPYLGRVMDVGCLVYLSNLGGSFGLFETLRIAIDTGWLWTLFSSECLSCH